MVARPLLAEGLGRVPRIPNEVCGALEINLSFVDEVVYGSSSSRQPPLHTHTVPGGRTPLKLLTHLRPCCGALLPLGVLQPIGNRRELVDQAPLVRVCAKTSVRVSVTFLYDNRQPDGHRQDSAFSRTKGRRLERCGHGCGQIQL